MSIVLKYSTEICKICHGDVSLKNIVINHIWDNDTDDDDKDGDDVKDNNDKLEVNNNINEQEMHNQNLTVDTTSTSVIDNDIYNLANLEATTVVLSAITSPSPSPPPRQVLVKAHSLVINNDNSFSLNEVDDFGYQINSVSLFIYFIY